MTHKLDFWRSSTLAFLLLLPAALSHAAPESPVVQGLAGAGTAGNAREALFANPASAAMLTNAFGFASYALPSVPEFHSGGRSMSIGAYDGGNPGLKGGFGYIRNSRAVVANGGQGYEDFNEMRFVLAHEVVQNINFGVLGRYIGEYHGDGGAVHRFDGSVGATFPVFQAIRGGLTLENLANRKDDQPMTAGAGLNIPIGYGAQIYTDGHQLLKGSRKNYKGYSLAAEMAIASDFTFRGGRFEEGFRHLKGWSLGLSWAGPRASFDYAFRIAGQNPHERDHIFGMTLLM
jgi:hypothetical protein